jgi:hypothetical protein
MRFTIALTDEAIKEKRIAYNSKDSKGLYIRIGQGPVIDRIIGWHPEHTLINYKCYQSGKSTIEDIWQALNDKDGFITITKYI